MEKDKQHIIMQSTLNLIAERGFHDTPMSLIARRSGVSAGIIYHYFEGKDDLIQSLYRQVKEEFSAALMAGNPQELPWPDHLQHIWMNAFHYYVSHPAETHFLEQYENSPYHQEWMETENEHTAALFALIEQDFAAGVLRPLPPMVLYDLTLGVAIALAKRQIAGTLQLDDKQLSEIAAAICRTVTAT